MTGTPSAYPDDAALDQWIREGLASLDKVLDYALDIDAGLRDARLPDLYASLDRALDATLDVDGGLEAILPRPEHPPTEPALASGTESTTAPTALVEFAQRWALRPIQERLALRSQLPLAELRAARTIALMYIGANTLASHFTSALTRVRDLDRARDILRDLVHILDHTHAHDLNDELDRDLDLVRDLVYDLVYELAGDFAHDLGHDHLLGRVLDRNIALAGILAGDLAFVFALARTHGLDLELASALDRDRDRTRDRELARAIPHDCVLTLDRDLTRDRDIANVQAAVDAIAALDVAATDFTDADLAHVDLQGIDLRGVRWSERTTRWPPDWQDMIMRASVQVAPDRRPELYEIRGDPRVWIPAI